MKKIVISLAVALMAGSGAAAADTMKVAADVGYSPHGWPPPAAASKAIMSIS